MADIKVYRVAPYIFKSKYYSWTSLPNILYLHSIRDDIPPHRMYRCLEICRRLIETVLLFKKSLLVVYIIVMTIMSELGYRHLMTNMPCVLISQASAIATVKSIQKMGDPTDDILNVIYYTGSSYKYVLLNHTLWQSGNSIYFPNVTPQGYGNYILRERELEKGFPSRNINFHGMASFSHPCTFVRLILTLFFY